MFVGWQYMFWLLTPCLMCTAKQVIRIAYYPAFGPMHRHNPSLTTARSHWLLSNHCSSVTDLANLVVVLTTPDTHPKNLQTVSYES